MFWSNKKHKRVHLGLPFLSFPVLLRTSWNDHNLTDRIRQRSQDPTAASAVPTISGSKLLLILRANLPNPFQITGAIFGSFRYLFSSCLKKKKTDSRPTKNEKPKVDPSESTLKRLFMKFFNGFIFLFRKKKKTSFVPSSLVDYRLPKTNMCFNSKKHVPKDPGVSLRFRDSPEPILLFFGWVFLGPSKPTIFSGPTVWIPLGWKVFSSFFTAKTLVNVTFLHDLWRSMPRWRRSRRRTKDSSVFIIQWLGVSP